MVRSMMNLTTLPLSFWDYALESATHILNMVPTKKVDKTPYELWYGKVPNLSYLKVWGCEALVKRDTLDKLEQRSVKCIFIGYPKETMGYYFYFPPENKIIVASRPEFEELNSMYFNKCIVLLEEFIRDEDMAKKDVDEVVVVGGSSRIPKVQLMLVEFFDGKTLCNSLNADEVVASCAAILAARCCYKIELSSSDSLLTDTIYAGNPSVIYLAYCGNILMSTCRTDNKTVDSSNMIAHNGTYNNLFHMLGSMTPELHRQFKLYYPFDMIQELKSRRPIRNRLMQEGQKIRLRCKGNDKNGILSLKALKTLSQLHGSARTKEDACPPLARVSHCKRNCPSYLAELIKKKKQVGTASSSDVFIIELFLFLLNSGTKRAKRNLNSTYLWHCRLAHISKKRIEKLQQEGLLKSTDDESFNQCVSCLSGKMTRKSFPHRPERATDLLGIIHTDVCSPLRHVSRQECLKNQLGKTIKAIRSDRGGEYISQEFKDYLKANGIVQQLTPPYTPQHNGVSERRNRTLNRTWCRSGIDFSTKISRPEFEELNSMYFNKCIVLLEEFIRDEDMAKKDVDEVVVVGGSSRIPKVQLMLVEFFDGKTLCNSLNADEVVASCAAILAARLSEDDY
ncbi:retrotransposon protein, putative, ty1-copia subclass [Tanacetum coccineum]|uniref:Retrotransposon protein, putative, ty1-copia subclass n=1 Tax=Tanacetum coccineum TaxID=301880 RepID=A0ABQ5AMY7_9ASTR